MKLAGSISNSNGSPFALAMTMSTNRSATIPSRTDNRSAPCDVTFRSRRTDTSFPASLFARLAIRPKTAHLRSVDAGVDDIKRLMINIDAGYLRRLPVIAGISVAFERRYQELRRPGHSGRRENTARL